MSARLLRQQKVVIFQTFLDVSILDNVFEKILCLTSTSKVTDCQVTGFMVLLHPHTSYLYFFSLLMYLSQLFLSFNPDLSQRSSLEWVGNSKAEVFPVGPVDRRNHCWPLAFSGGKYVS